MANTTVNYGWVKPVVGGDQDTWGGELNNDLDGIDAVVFGIHGIAATALQDAPTSGGPFARQAGAWVALPPSGAGIAASPPATPFNGQFWWDSVGGQLYVYYMDGTSNQWVVANNAEGISDAPSDGTAYFRENGVWTNVIDAGTF